MTPHSFFFVVPPGLEALAKKELQDKYSIVNQWAQELKLPTTDLPNIEIAKGGFELTLPLLHGSLLNLVLKIPTKILIRIASFKAKDFPTLHKKLKNFPWGEWMEGDQAEVQVSTTGSRLKMKARIEDVFKEALKDHFLAQPARKTETPHTPQIFLRIVDDTVTMSLNTSGNFLFKRGYRMSVTEGSLRENFAASLYFAMKLFAQEHNIATPLTLKDPLCGSGTLLFESLLFNSLTLKDFSFWHFRALKSYRTKKYQLLETPKLKVFGSDKSKRAIQAAQDNYKMVPDLKIQFDIKDYKDVTCENTDWVLSNLPYGVQVKSDIPPFQVLTNALQHFANASLKGFLVSELQPQEIKKLKPKQILAFSNSGIPVQFLIF